MNSKLSARIFFFIIISLAQIISCKKEPAQGIPTPTPPSLVPTKKPPAVGFGSVSFWILNAADLYYGHGYISINGETRVSNCDWLDTGPQDCNNPCTVQFDLPEGDYSWKAWKSLGDTVRGTVTVIKGSCTLQQINF